MSAAAAPRLAAANRAKRATTNQSTAPIHALAALPESSMSWEVSLFARRALQVISATLLLLRARHVITYALLARARLAAALIPLAIARVAQVVSSRPLRARSFARIATPGATKAAAARLCATRVQRTHTKTSLLSCRANRASCLAVPACTTRHVASSRLGYAFSARAVSTRLLVPHLHASLARSAVLRDP